MNWRDTSNPAAGGAERFTEEIAKRLVSYGNSVTIFTSRFEKAEPEIYKSGVRTIRLGGKYTVYFKAREYVRQHLSEFDIIIDEINTVPFQLNSFAKTRPVVALIHQLAREIWFYETRFPLSALGYFALEPYWLRKYRRVPTITVSASTKSDLLARGFEHVYVVHNGTSMPPNEQVDKINSPIIVYLGRLVRSKHPEHAIQAFRPVRTSFPDAELWIIGDGYLRRELEREAPDGVNFYGKVTEQEKYDLLMKGHILLAPSVREGWGISVMEANSLGTTAIGYCVPGLKDSIVDKVTGVLVPPSDVGALSKAILGLLANPEAWHQLSTNAIEWSKKFNWDDSAHRFEELLNTIANGF